MAYRKTSETRPSRRESFAQSLACVAMLVVTTAVACGDSHDVGDSPASARKPSKHGGKDASVEKGDAGKTQTGAAADGGGSKLEHFSFFVTSQAGLIDLANAAGLPNGFGGDLRYGESGDGAGLRGADKICTELAEKSMPGASAKRWRAFLSTSYANAIDRIGEGPWYDRLGRVLALTKADLLNERPASADPALINDFPNEDGVLNHDPDGTGQVDNHDMLTGSNAQGMLYVPDTSPGAASTNCQDWSSTDAAAGRPRVGHSWTRDMGPGGFPGGGFPGFGDGGFPPFPGFGGDGGLPGTGPGDPFSAGVGADGSFNHWISALDEAGCGAGGSVIEMGPPDPNSSLVGSGGGYGGFYCFALQP